MHLKSNIDRSSLVAKEILVLVRHGQDIPTLSKTLNQPLIEETKPEIRLLGKNISTFCTDIKNHKICIYHSNRLRSIQTVAILAESLYQSHHSVEMHQAKGLREIYQGDFVITDYPGYGNYKPLQDAWKVWQEKLDQSELLYRFGDPDPLPSGEPRYPFLIGKFKKFGENQREFSLRLYKFLLKILSNNYDGMMVAVGHQASCSRIQRICDAINNLKSPNDFQPGDFVKYKEKRGSRITLDPAYGAIIRKPDIHLASAVIKKEIDYLSNLKPLKI